MTEKEKMLMYEKYMRDRNFSPEKIKYNLSVVECLSSQVLVVFGQGLENIDTYSFEEFTDMVMLIDDKLGGREGISKMLEAMMDLTECLKLNKLIKGGKIAHYKRMFSDLDYYIDKYDMMTGRKDDTKEYIKTITTNRFSSAVIKIADDINVYEFETLEKIEKILNDVPFEQKELNDEIKIIKHILIDLRLFDEKNGQMETTKKGRALSRLAAEERYGALVYLLLYNVNWNNVISQYSSRDVEMDFNNALYILASIFNKTKEIILNVEAMKDISEEEILHEISTEKFRIAKIESMPYGYTILDICFIGMGLMEIEKGKDAEIIYRATGFGQQIFKIIYSEGALIMRNNIETIRYMIKNRKYDKAEVAILEFLSTYGGNVVIWDYFGQLLLLKRNYRYAYTVLKNAYENSSKRGRAAKSVLYHLVLCCRKLQLKDDIENYESLLQVMEKV
jgi:hypothetical protein